MLDVWAIMGDVAVGLAGQGLRLLGTGGMTHRGCSYVCVQEAQEQPLPPPSVTMLALVHVRLVI